MSCLQHDPADGRPYEEGFNIFILPLDVDLGGYFSINNSRLAISSVEQVTVKEGLCMEDISANQRLKNCE